MRWQLGRRSSNVEDRRGAPASGGMRLPRGMPTSRAVRRGGIGGLGLIVIALIAMFLGVDPSFLFQGTPSTHIPFDQAPQAQRPAGQDEAADFVSVVLANTEDTWREVSGRMGRVYPKPKLVLFSGAAQSACGFAESATGPFYCAADQKVYLDLDFFRELRDRFQAPGDFAAAYVIAHEIGHHVQTLLGITQEVQAARQQVGGAQANELSVMLELHADCLAGIWANYARKSPGLLEEGDIEEGLNAAAAIGDDRLQRQAQGFVVPDAFTHGSSAQRVRWFKQGLATGDPSSCDTFNAERL